MQRTDRGAALQRAIGGGGITARALYVEGDDGVEARVVPLGAREQMIEKLAAADRAPADQAGELLRGPVMNVDHPSPPNARAKATMISRTMHPDMQFLLRARDVAGAPG